MISTDVSSKNILELVEIIFCDVSQIAGALHVAADFLASETEFCREDPASQTANKRLSHGCHALSLAVESLDLNKDRLSLAMERLQKADYQNLKVAEA